MSFRNSILSGMGKLIRDFIQSPNYVPGVSGWTINKDGTAEFADITARGDLTGSTLTIPAGAGPGVDRVIIDSNGITVWNAANQQILMIWPLGSAPLQVNGIISLPNGFSEVRLTDSLALLATNRGQLPNTFADFVFNDPLNIEQEIYVQLNGLNRPRYKFGDGFPGGYYYSECAVTAGQVIINQSTTPVTFPGAQANFTDYPAPNDQFAKTVNKWRSLSDDSIYTIDFMLRFAAWVSGSYLAVLIQDDTAGAELGRFEANIGFTGARTGHTSWTGIIPANHDVSFRVYQATGVSQTIQAGQINILRHL